MVNEKIKALKELIRVCGSLYKTYGKILDDKTKDTLESTIADIHDTLYDEVYQVIRDEVNNSQQ